VICEGACHTPKKLWAEQPKADQNCQKNLSKSQNHQKPSVKDVPEDKNGNSDEDLYEHDFDFLDDGSGNSED